MSAAVGLLAIAVVVFGVYAARSGRPPGRASAATMSVDDDRAQGGRMTATTPDWLVQTEVGLCPCGCIGKRSKGSFVEKTIGGGARVMRAGDVLRRHRREAGSCSSRSTLG